MSEKDILSWLKYGDYRSIFVTIIESAKTASEISKLTGIKIEDVAENLHILERNKAVTYTNDGWRATELGIEVHNKFFK